MKIPDVPFDFRTITDTIQRSLATAGLGQQAGLMKGVTDTVEQALAASGLIREVHAPSEREHVGEFVSRSFTNSAGTRTYKLYIPASYSSDGIESMPLLVMLHGCSQTPDDFAAGTRMNALAEQHGFLVAYPAQSAQANKSRCWKWYSANDQARERGEPSILAGITRQVVASYRIDERRVFVAGLSAGGAMAVILGATYPELFAAVGAHSGLPYGAAHDVASAFGAMKGKGAQTVRVAQPVPTIVFHGERDPTVNARNGAAIAEQAATGRAEALLERVETGATPGGRTYSRKVHTDASGHALVEHWLLEGAGHAWSGGCPSGSFTDALGPDASAEMIRFFLAQPRFTAQPAQPHSAMARAAEVRV